MASLIIQGGRKVSGETTASGSKNGALALMAATLLIEGETVLKNIPRIGDVFTMIEVLRSLGVQADWVGPNVIMVDATEIKSSEAPSDLVKKMRASFSVLGPVLARTGNARVSFPGGCDIGARPIDLHLKGIAHLGAMTRNDHGVIETSANRLVGSTIYLDFPSAGATQQIMCAATLAEGVTTIENCASEPEVADVARFLNQCGAKITGAGTPVIQIEGVRKLEGTEYSNIPDRVETGTLALAAISTKGSLFIRDAVAEHCSALLQKIQEIGAIAEEDNSGIFVAWKRPCVATDIVTMPHPGFPTDLQQPMGAVLTTAEGTSIITEKVYEHRFRYLNELQRMGADVKAENRTAVIRGVPHLTGAHVTASDLRAGAALVIAAMGADGITEIADVEHINRGYENFEDKLNSIGGSVLPGKSLISPETSASEAST